MKVSDQDLVYLELLHKLFKEGTFPIKGKDADMLAECPKFIAHWYKRVKAELEFQKNPPSPKDVKMIEGPKEDKIIPKKKRGRPRKS